MWSTPANQNTSNNGSLCFERETESSGSLSSKISSSTSNRRIVGCFSKLIETNQSQLSKRFNELHHQEIGQQLHQSLISYLQSSLKSKQGVRALWDTLQTKGMGEFQSWTQQLITCSSRGQGNHLLLLQVLD